MKEAQQTASTPQPRSGRATPRWAERVATVGGVGYLRPGPGSWGSAAAVALWWLAVRWTPAFLQPSLVMLMVAAAVMIGIPAATLVARGTGFKDPQFVVIDEVAGQWITLIGAPLAWKSVLAGFILFRGFDIVKPPPARQLERLAEGGGIVLDDVAAGLYGLIIMQLLVHFRILP